MGNFGCQIGLFLNGPHSATLNGQAAMAEKKLASFMESLDISTQVFGFFGASKPGGFFGAFGEFQVTC